MNSITKAALSGSSSLEIANLDGQLVVDSRLIAADMGIQHETVIKSIRKYAAKFQAMGNLRFEIGTSHPNANGACHQVNFVCLNEVQSTFLMTLSKNTEKVVDCKFNLSIAFDKAKSIIKTVIPAQNDRIRELELENENLQRKERLISLTNTLVGMHGSSLGLAIAGVNVGQTVEVKIPITEVLNPVNGDTQEFLDAKQLASEVQRRTGQKVSNAEFIRKVRAANRDDLIVPVTRNATCEYIHPDSLNEAIGIVYGRQRQKLIGE
jgi:phage regulator Rha-like protein